MLSSPSYVINYLGSKFEVRVLDFIFLSDQLWWLLQLHLPGVYRIALRQGYTEDSLARVEVRGFQLLYVGEIHS